MKDLVPMSIGFRIESEANPPSDRNKNRTSFSFNKPTRQSAWITRVTIVGLRGVVPPDHYMNIDAAWCLSDSNSKVYQDIIDTPVFENTLVTLPDNGKIISGSNYLAWEGKILFPESPRIDVFWLNSSNLAAVQLEAFMNIHYLVQGVIPK